MNIFRERHWSKTKRLGPNIYSSENTIKGFRDVRTDQTDAVAPLPGKNNALNKLFWTKFFSVVCFPGFSIIKYPFKVSNKDNRCCYNLFIVNFEQVLSSRAYAHTFDIEKFGTETSRLVFNVHSDTYLAALETRRSLFGHVTVARSSTYHCVSTQTKSLRSFERWYVKNRHLSHCLNISAPCRFRRTRLQSHRVITCIRYCRYHK